MNFYHFIHFLDFTNTYICCLLASLVSGNFDFVLLFGSALHNILQQAVFSHFFLATGTPIDACPLDSGHREMEREMGYGKRSSSIFSRS